MRRPEVSTRWDAAVTIDNLHTTDLHIDNDYAAGEEADDNLLEDKPAAYFGDFYEHYRKAFLSMETHPALVRCIRRALGREYSHHRSETLGKLHCGLL